MLERYESQTTWPRSFQQCFRLVSLWLTHQSLSVQVPTLSNCKSTGWPPKNRTHQLFITSTKIKKKNSNFVHSNFWTFWWILWSQFFMHRIYFISWKKEKARIKFMNFSEKCLSSVFFFFFFFLSLCRHNPRILHSWLKQYLSSIVWVMNVIFSDCVYRVNKKTPSEPIYFWLKFINLINWYECSRATNTYPARNIYTMFSSWL